MNRHEPAVLPENQVIDGVNQPIGYKIKMCVNGSQRKRVVSKA